MTDYPEIRSFIADWFARFDRLDPIDAFLLDFHPDVDWDMPDVDTTLSGHDRVRAWYRGVLETLQRPTEHHVSKIAIEPGTARFEVLFRARQSRASVSKRGFRKTGALKPDPVAAR